MSDIDDLKEKIQKLERKFRDIAIIGIVSGICLTIFVGYKWQDIPKMIAEAIDQKVIKDATEKANEYAEKAKIASSEAERASAESQGELANARSIVAEIESTELKRISSIEQELSRLPKSPSGTKQKIRGGSTKPGATEWKYYKGTTPGAITVDVDTSEAKFTTTPIYTISITGRSHHWLALGTASVYKPSKTGFSVYLKQDNLTPKFVNDKEWAVAWQAIGD